MPTKALPLFLALLAVPALAQHGVEGLSNPFNTPEDAEAGGRIFRSHCAVCHGPEGSGGKAADLTTGRFRHGSADSDLYKTISEGIPGTEMPGIFFNGKQMWQIVAYVRSLSQGRAAEQAKGDAAAGKNLFFGKGACSNCHRVNGEGSRTGPDLTDIGAMRSLAHLEAAIVDPNQQVLPQHWYVDAVTKDGKIVRGRRLNEDTFSVQLLGVDQRLTSLRKDELKEYKVVKTSAMPSYQGKFSDAEFQNLVAYLASLRLSH
jgi:putative heme-binding domain-containing protein